MADPQVGSIGRNHSAAMPNHPTAKRRQVGRTPNRT
jgi:hypothetical protein